jgi:hypothetical protein
MIASATTARIMSTLLWPIGSPFVTWTTPELAPGPSLATAWGGVGSAAALY